MYALSLSAAVVTAVMRLFIKYNDILDILFLIDTLAITPITLLKAITCSQHCMRTHESRLSETNPLSNRTTKEYLNYYIII